MMAYGLAATLLASRGAMHSVHFQYTTFIYPFAFALVPFAVMRLAPDLHRPGHKKLRTMLVIAVPWPLSSLSAGVLLTKS